MLETQVYAFSGGRLERVEAAEDGVEQANRLLARHEADVDERHERATESSSPKLDKEELDRLRSLGYVDEPGGKR